jgi:hypothetical protein
VYNHVCGKLNPRLVDVIYVDSHPMAQCRHFGDPLTSDELRSARMKTRDENAHV